MFRSYRETLLAPDEPVRHVTHPHWFGVLGQTLKGIALLVLVLAGIVVLQFLEIFPIWFQPYRPIAAMFLGSIAATVTIFQLIHWLRWRSHEIVVTDRRVIRITGIFSKDVIDYSLDAINDLRLRQSWLGRVFNYGDIEIFTASDDVNRPRDTFPLVSDPIGLTHAVQHERESRRQPHTALNPPTQSAR